MRGDEPFARLGVRDVRGDGEGIGKRNAGPVVIDGIVACPCSPAWVRMLPGLPMKLPKKPECARPWNGEPKPILKAQRTQTMSTTANAANVSIMLLIDHRFCITPP